MKAMTNRMIVLFLIFFLSGCSSPGMISNVREKVALINYGDSKEEVLEALGEPGSKISRSPDEAWQYCTNGFTREAYATVWFTNDTVVGVTNRVGFVALGLCNQGFRKKIDWTQKPTGKK